ncbi:MAG: hypothetical protein ACI88G_001978 [Woeseiaceae bacterium]|jgi:hypothetical protein
MRAPTPEQELPLQQCPFVILIESGNWRALLKDICFEPLADVSEQMRGQFTEFREQFTELELSELSPESQADH